MSKEAAESIRVMIERREAEGDSMPYCRHLLGLIELEAERAPKEEA